MNVELRKDVVDQQSIVREEDEKMEMASIITIPYIQYKLDKASTIIFTTCIVSIILIWYYFDLFSYVKIYPNVIFIFIGSIIFCISQIILQSPEIGSLNFELDMIKIAENMSGVMIGTIILFIVFNKLKIDSKLSSVLIISVICLSFPCFFWGIGRSSNSTSTLRKIKQGFLLLGVTLFISVLIIIVLVNKGGYGNN